jgi:Zn-dependent peptidase ImmA (M78 family)
LEIGFESDPDEGRGTSAEESASWGWFRLFADDINLCQHVANSELSDRVHWYLLPLLEWFVENWDSLLHETKLPSSFVDALSARQGFRTFNPYRTTGAEDTEISDNDDEERDAAVFDWAERHCIRASAEGGIFPDVFFRRARNEIEISWGHTRVQGAPNDLRFLAPAGQVLLDPLQTASHLYQAVKQATETLSKRAPQNVRLSKLSAELAALQEPRTMQRAAWMAGIGGSIQASEVILARLTQEWGPRHRELIVPQGEALVIGRAPAAVLMFGSLSPSVNEDDVRALLDLLKEAAGHSNGMLRLPAIEHDEPGINAWEQGYALANLSRKAMAVPETPYKVNLDELLSQSGVEQRDVMLSDTKIRAISICGEGLRSLIAINQASKHNESEPGLRFTLAHELCHLLFDEEEGVPLAVASGPWAPAAIEKRANAFAAMFLMPADACRALLNEYGMHGGLNKYTISGIAAAFGTGKVATLRHLQNLGLVDADEVTDIEEDFAN